MHDSKLEEEQVAPFYNELVRVRGQLNELWQAAKVVNDLSPDSSTTEWNVALYNLNKVLHKTGVL